MKATQFEFSQPYPCWGERGLQSCTSLLATNFAEKLTLCPQIGGAPYLTCQITLPTSDAIKLVDAIDDVTGCVTEFAEALADIAYEAGAAGFRLADSRATIPLFIQWAKEFCQINVGREWDGEYLEEIQAFTEAKMAPEIPDDDFIAKF